MRNLSWASALLWGALTTHPGWAASLGPAPANLVLGSPLVLSLALTLEEGDPIDPECVAAEVAIGERRLPGAGVRASVAAGASARERRVTIAAPTVVDEPVVSVQVSVGCSARISRHYTLFADPPFAAPGPSSGPMRTEPPRAGEAAAPLAAPILAEPSTATVKGPAAASATPRARPALTGVAAGQGVRSNRKSDRSRPGKAEASGSTKARAPATARLKLEPQEPAGTDAATPTALAVAQASSSAMQAASAAMLAASAAAAAEARVRALEVQLDRLVAQSRQLQAENLELRRRASVGSGFEGWAPWALAGAVALSGLFGWRAWRARRGEHSARPVWLSEAEMQTRADLTPDRDEPDAWARPAGAPAGAVATSGTGRASPVVEPALAEPGWTTMTPPRPVTVEELIDLEQQAEFFVVLGQDDAAVDLLVSHIRASGGISPLPYLKLLDIYHRRGERENYEHARERFNQRFNAYAPEWGTDVLQGRLLEDYPQVLATLQRVWPDPAAAMAELDALLWRSDRAPMFDLPAYREVLLLYSLARDLRDQDAAAADQIDLLLPLEPVEHQALPLPDAVDETRALLPDAHFPSVAPMSLDLDLGDASTDEATRPAAFSAPDAKRSGASGRS